MNCNDKHSAYYDYGIRHQSLMDAVGKKYKIKQFMFDTECIYGKEDLTKLVSKMLELPNFNYQFIQDGHDTLSNQYFTKFIVFDQEYEFRTSSLGDWVNLETIIPSLENIANKETPGYQFNLSNTTDQSACLIYARTDSLRLAINEGYPCSLPDNSFKSEINWEDGMYSIVTLAKIPKFKGLLKRYHKSLTELHHLGYDVPNIALKRIYIGSLFDENSFDIYIDSSQVPRSSNEFTENRVKCYWDGSGLILGYTLVKYYEGQVALFDKFNDVETKIETEKYLDLVLEAFGKSEEQ